MTRQQPATEKHTRACFEQQFLFDAPETPYRNCICEAAAQPAEAVALRLLLQRAEKAWIRRDQSTEADWQALGEAVDAVYASSSYSGHLHGPGCGHALANQPAPEAGEAVRLALNDLARETIALKLAIPKEALKEHEAWRPFFRALGNVNARLDQAEEALATPADPVAKPEPLDHTAECKAAMYRGPHVCICGASTRNRAVAKQPEGPDNITLPCGCDITLPCGCVTDGYQLLISCNEHSEAQP